VKQLCEKKRINLLILGVAIILAGCDTGTSGGDGEGVLGQVAGVVYDSIKGEPVKGVSVSLAGYKYDSNGTDKGLYTAETDDSGAYLFKDVPAKNYTVTYQHSGYRFVTRKLTVDPMTYVNQDPFKEIEILEVLKDREKADYTYRQNMRIELVGMSPLTTSVTGRLNLVKVNYDAFTTKPVPSSGEAADQPKLRLWFVEQDPYRIGTPAVGSEAVREDPVLGISGDKQEDTFIYGPFETEANGQFTVPNLPSGVSFKIVFADFTTEDGFFFGGSTAKFYNSTFSELEPIDPEKPGAVDLGNLYLFTTGIGLYVAGTEAGSNEEPLDPRWAKKAAETDPDKPVEIRIYFNEPVDPGSFVVGFATDSSYPNSNDAMWGDSSRGEPFNVRWEASDPEGKKQNTVAVLTPAQGLNGQVTPSLPYSLNGNRPVGNIVIDNISGKDGLQPVIMGLSIPVYTKESIKLAGIDLNPNPADLPSQDSRVMLTNSKAIKLTFSKPVGSAQFRFVNPNDDSDAQIPQYSIKPAKPTEVFVWTDYLMAALDPKDLIYGVVSNTDLADTIGIDPALGVLDDKYRLTAIKNEKAGSLELVGTNLPAKPASETIVNDGARFPVASPITLNFRGVLPISNLRADVALYEVDTESHNFKKLSLKPADGVKFGTDAAKGITTLTISPALALHKDKTHYLHLDIFQDGSRILSTDDKSFGQKYNNYLFQWVDKPDGLQIPGGNGEMSYITFRAVQDLGPVSGENTFTTEDLWANTLVVGNLSIGLDSFELVNGTAYYIQYNGIVPDDVAVTIKPVTGTSVNAAVAATAKKAGDSLVTFTVNYTGTGGSGSVSSGFDLTITGTGMYGIDNSNNSDGKSYTYTGLTVKKP
jgi:hypothetical protein